MVNCKNYKQDGQGRSDRVQKANSHMLYQRLSATKRKKMGKGKQWEG